MSLLARELLTAAAMHMRDAVVLTSLFAVTACPPPTGTTTDTNTDPSSTTADASTGTTGVSTTDVEPTSGTTEEASDTTTTASTGTTDATDTTDATGTTDSSTGTTGGLELLVETCAELHAEDPSLGDGEYTLHVGKDPLKPWTGYCHDMAGTPTDYLPLVNVQAGRNFSQYTASDPGETDLVTTFTRVRIDPTTLVVDIDDLTFSSSSGMVMHGGPVTSMPYGVAEGCAGSGNADGVGNIDLVGTPFKVIDPFCTKGAGPAGDAVFSMNDQVIDLTGGGNCGWTGPTKGDECVFDPHKKNSGFVLELEYMGAQPVLHETCAEVKADDPGAADGEYTLYVGKQSFKPWTAYCHDMAGTPKDYLPLVNVQAGRNFSQYTASGPGETDVVTTFTRVRIDPITLVVDIDDLTFSSSSGMVMHGGGSVTSMPYAIAEGCAGVGEVDGVANIDLVGTPFEVLDPFCTKGAGVAGNANFSMNDQVVDLAGGGDCGWIGPTKGNDCVFDPHNKNSGFVLELGYIETLHQTCASIKAEQPGAADGEYTLYSEGNEYRPWTAYCHDMAGTPREYLPLVNVQDGRNYSFWPASALTPGTDLLTRFTRLRIDPLTLVVDIDDRTFSESTGEVVLNGNPVNEMPYGVALSCTAEGLADSTANIDLNGTKFRVNDTFCIAGFMPAGEAVPSDFGRIVDITGGGYCGWSGPKKGNNCIMAPQNFANGFALELEYFDP